MVACIAFDRERTIVNVLMRRKGPGTGRNVSKWEKAPSPFLIPREGWPTEAPPGTTEKVLVMLAREGRGEELFHPYDAKIEGDVRPLLFYLMKWEERQPLTSGRE